VNKKIVKACALLSAVGIASVASAQVDLDGTVTAPALGTGPAPESGEGLLLRNRSEWINLAGRVDLADDFDTLATDESFRASRTALRGGWSARQVGVTTLLNFRNEVDAPPFGFVDNNGSTNISCWVDYPEIGETGITVMLNFDRPLQGWGAEFWGAASGEKLDIEFLDNQGTPIALIGATKTRSDEHEFIGFIAPPGVEIDRIYFKARNRRLGTGGEGFGMDNMLVIFADAGQTCYADCDSGSGPGALDIFDFLCFQNRFAAQDPWACDCDVSTGGGLCDVFDFLCFQNAFAAGCP
jgi:hypothetical protein